MSLISPTYRSVEHICSRFGRITTLFSCFIIGISWSVHAQEGATVTPESTELYVDLEQVKPGLMPQEAPSDAIVLFDGTDLAGWQAMQLRIAGDMPGMVERVAD